jgi:hypothetical protein
LKERGVDYSAVSKNKEALLELCVKSDPDASTEETPQEVEPTKPTTPPPPQEEKKKSTPEPTPTSTPTPVSVENVAAPNPYPEMGRLALIKILKQRRVDYSSVSKDKDALVELCVASDPALVSQSSG